MYAELILWGYLPMIAAAMAALASIYCAVRAPSAFQVVAAVLVVAGSAASELALYSMVRGTWPTVLPHVVIAASLLVVFVQVRRLSAGTHRDLTRGRA